MTGIRDEKTRAVSSWSVYMLRCADDSLYTGIATDVDRRVAEHASGRRGAKYLKGRLPVSLVFVYEAGDRSSASRLEYRIKRLSRAEKERLVEAPRQLDDWIAAAVDVAGDPAR